jgi:hypothetical protein
MPGAGGNRIGGEKVVIAKEDHVSSGPIHDRIIINSAGGHAGLAKTESHLCSNHLINL